MKNRKIIYLKGKRLLKQLLRKDVWNYTQVIIPKEFHGSEYEGWCVASNMLSADSIVYSIGIGNDVSFDLSLMNRYSVKLFAYDPTPEVIDWVARQRLPESFQFFGIGVANYDGIARFYRSKNETNICHSIIQIKETLHNAIEVPVKRLSSLCLENNHRRIDLLKMDVEGAEYDVLKDIMDSEVRIDQILVEFHHRFKNISVSKTKRTISLLNERGYKIFYVSLKGREYSFIHKRLLRN